MRTIALLTLTTFASSSCVTSRSLDVRQLTKLDGYRASDPVQALRVLDVTGPTSEQVELRPGRRLSFSLTGGEKVNEEFSRLELAAGVLKGITSSGRPLLVELSKISSAEVSWCSPWKTFGLVAAIVAGAFLLTLGGGYLILRGGLSVGWT